MRLRASVPLSAQVSGNRPDPSPVPYLLDGKNAVRFEFPLTDDQTKRPARLRIHTADQAEKSPPRSWRR